MSDVAIPKLVVGVGASAGGLEAFKQLLHVLPGSSGMAFVLVQHLDPTHKSLLTELIAPFTPMVVKEAEDGERLLPDTVYVIPSDAALAVSGGRIELSPPTLQRGARLSVDHLLRSLARDFGPRAVGIVLSGAGSDGSAGLRDIKAAGGLVIVQDPSTCQQTGMPQSAIDTGAVDLVIKIEEMPAALERFERLPPSAREEAPPAEPPVDELREAPPLSKADLDRLNAVLDANAGLDLRVYKEGTIVRRVLRRMALGGHEGIDAYLEHLRREPAEQRTLFRDLLISVTDFFRDPPAYEALREAVVAPLVQAAQPGEALRVWVPGCATGEEAYSLATDLLAAAELRGKRIPLQIFATDVDREALAFARAGVYPPAIAEHVPASTLGKYFLPIEGRGYQVRSALRDCVSFAVHDLTKDPPFSRMNLVSCRNVLIYLRPPAQEHVLKAIHFALQPGGYLFLGSSETAGAQRELFSTISKPWRIYRKIGTSRAVGFAPHPPRPAVGAGGPYPTRSPSGEAGGHGRRAPGVADLARRLVMQARVPPTIVLAEDGTVLFLHGELRPFLRFPEGEPRLELASLVSPDLATRTRAALYKCRRDRQTVVAHSSPGDSDGPRTRITASPARELGEGTVILTFEAVEDAPAAPAPGESAAHESVIEQLEQELRATREDLRNTVEELESSNEELRSANEEATSMNEELQAANEELEATTEELRSLNEELTTVNAQLREKIEQVERAHDDISNFFASTKIATLFLDERLLVKRFTPAAEELLHVDPGDLGRFVGDIARELLQDGLVEEAREVLEHLSSRTRELRTQDGRWLTRRVLPYRTESRRIEGVVVTWSDVTELKIAIERRAARERQQEVVARMGMRALEESGLQRFLDEALREIQQTLRADVCELLELQPDGDGLLVRAATGWGEGLPGEELEPSGTDSLAGFTLQAKGPIFTESLPEDRRFPASRRLVEAGLRGALACAVDGGEAVYGTLGVLSREPRRFTPEDANFLQSCASVLGAAIIRSEARARMVLERAAAEASAEGRGLEAAARRIYTTGAQELSIDVAELWQPLADGDFERTACFAAEHRLTEEFGPDRLPGARGFIGRVASRRRAEWLSSLQDPSRFLRVEKARRLGLASGLALPIVTGSEVVGILALFSRRRLHADAAFLRSLEGIGRVLGDFVRRAELERRFRTTVEAAPSGIADRSLDGRFLRANRRFCEITGYTLEELTALSFQSITHPDDLAREEALFRELRDGQRETFSIEKRYLRKDGEAVWVSLGAAAAAGPSGRPAFSVVVVDDITSRKRTEQALRDSEERFRQIMESSPAPMMAYDDQGEIVAVSRSWNAATGYSLEELPTVEAWMRTAFRMSGEELASALRTTWSADDATSERSRELELWRKDGTPLTFLVRARSLSASRDGRRLRVAAAVDITERRRFERELVEAGRQKDEFIAMLGHELRNPLAAMRSATELLKRCAPEDARIERVQGILDRQTSHMSRLLDGLLDISRIIHGKISLERQVVDLAAVVRQVTADASQRIPDGLDLVADPVEGPLPVDGDPVRLAQIVDNLVSNAIKYTPAPGRVLVRLERGEGQGVLRVKDTGDGIDPSLLPNLFKAFQQGRQSLDRRQGGLGLGLALVKVLAELHGGAVEARSDGLGQGAEFLVRLPLSGERLVERPAPARPAGTRRILLIEDNLDAAEMLKEGLEFEGHEVALATRGAEGIELARRLSPDVVLCDLGLPDAITGFDVARTLRADPETKDLFLVALTGYGRSEDRRRSEEAGFDAHLTKPISLDGLDRVLASAGRGSRS